MNIKGEILELCSGKKLWALFGFIDSVNVVCLQVASAGDIVTEIANDLCNMQPVCAADIKVWESGLHKKVFNVTYRLDARCQKYRDMYDSYDGFYVVTIDYQKFLGKTETYIFDNVKFAEVMFADMTCSLYWKLFGEESKILNII